MLTRAAALAVLAVAWLPASCVAAAALPVLAAGGAIAGSQVSSAPSRAAGSDRAPAGAAFLRTAALAPTRGVEVLEGVTELPPPSESAGGSDTLAAMRVYVERRLAAPGATTSALLADPTTLAPEREPCRERPPTLLIDLDPAGGLAPLAPPVARTPALAAVLRDLRDRGATIAWMTDRPPADAAPLRAALRDSGLDAAGRDPLLVARYPGESKQARRQVLNRTHCMLAIAGDAREDFDELYAYLRQPEAALRLEALLGDGWFLIANPLD